MTIWVLLLFLLLFYGIYQWFFHTRYLSDVKVANEAQNIPNTKLNPLAGNTINATYSIWVYVNDWSIRYGEDKIIFQRGNDLKVFLAANTNTLTVECKITNASYDMHNKRYFWNVGNYGTQNAEAGFVFEDHMVAYTGTDYSTALPGCKTLCNSTAGCQGFNFNFSGDNKSNNQVPCNLIRNTKGNTLTGSMVDSEGINDMWSVGVKDNSKTNRCTVQDLPLQTWVNIVVSTTATSVDVYLNGILIQSCPLEGEVSINNKEDLLICPQGGFNGWTSRFYYTAKYINPEEAMDLYRDGSGASFSQGYKLNVIVTKGGEEKANVTI